MNKKELDRILSMHQHWLEHDCEAWEQMRAGLSMYDLRGADLRNADLCKANLCRANLQDADLSGTDLSGANLHRTNLDGADLSMANLRCANLSMANLHGANLDGADLHGANLTGANLAHADIYTADFDKKEQFRKGVILTKPIKGYKKTAEGVVITAEIPAGAIVFSINGGKCRSSMATILDMDGHKVLHSQHDPKFTYTPGKKIIITGFDTRYNIECGKGFHFFRTKKEAEAY